MRHMSTIGKLYGLVITKCVNTIMINIEDEYRGLLSAVLHGGTPKEDRTGTGTKAVFGRMLRHDMELGFPILTGKKYILKMQSQNYFGSYRDVQILIISIVTVSSIGILIMNALVDTMGLWALYTASSGAILVVLTSLGNLLVTSKKIRTRVAIWFQLGIHLSSAIWFCLLATTVSKFILMMES